MGFSGFQWLSVNRGVQSRPPSQFTKEDSYKYWRHYQERKREPRTIYNGLRSINRFLNDPLRNLAADRRLSEREMPDYDENPVDYYIQEDIKKLFAA